MNVLISFMYLVFESKCILFLETSIDTSTFCLNGHGGISKAPSCGSSARQGSCSQQAEWNGGLPQMHCERNNRNKTEITENSCRELGEMMEDGGVAE